MAARALTVAFYAMKASLLGQMAYRMDFWIQLAMAFFWAGWALAPLMLIYELRDQVAGFSRDEAMLVLSAFIIAKALLDGLISPNLVAVVEHVRRGTLDFVLLKPIDPQLLVSFGRVVFAKLVDLVAGIALGVWALSQLERAPSAEELALAASMLLAGLAILYSLWLMVVSLAFWFVKVDNLAYLFGSIFDAGRWPITVFRGWARVLLTFVFPIAVVTSFPALAVLGRLGAEAAIGAFGLAAGFLGVSRLVWRWALQHYSSASS